MIRYFKELLSTLTPPQKEYTPVNSECTPVEKALEELKTTIRILSPEVVEEEIVAIDDGSLELLRVAQNLVDALEAERGKKK